MCKAWEEHLEEGKRIGEKIGIECSAKVYKTIVSGEQDNEVIAKSCGCSVHEVEKIRKAFEI